MNPDDDHFALLGLPRRFAIDDAALERAYRSLQSTVHPDRFVRAGAAEQRVALQWATRANEAYRTLRDPLRRATWLCVAGGVDPADEHDTTMAPDFLMQQLEWREALDEAKEHDDRAAIAALAATLDDAVAALRARVAHALDVDGDAKAASGLVRQWMFVAKLRDAVEPLDGSRDAPPDADAVRATHDATAG